MAPIAPFRIFLAFLRLGLTSFGGPVAHLGYFHRALIQRRHWLDERSYAELVALCHFLPGPSSSQVCIGIGLAKGGWRGAVAAWSGFTLPSAVLMIALGLGMRSFGAAVPSWLFHGLILAAVPVVAQAIWQMTPQLCPDWPRLLMAAAMALLVTLFQMPNLQPLMIAAGAAAGWLFLKGQSGNSPAPLSVRFNDRTATVSLGLFFFLLLLLPLAGAALHSHALSVFGAFYRSGALVFGGGHVVLPLLQSAAVAPGWVSGGDFLAGYGAAQAMPGPLFSFAAFLGAVMTSPPNHLEGAILCLAAIYLPSFLLLFGALPFWEAVRHRPGIWGALNGVNAAVVGLLLAAFIGPVCISAIRAPSDMVLALAGFALLVAAKVPSWAVVAFTVAGAGLVSAAWT